MVNISYEEGEPLTFSSKSKPRGIIGFLISRNVVRNQYEANLLLVIVIVVCFALSAFFLWPKNQTSSTPVPVVTPGFEA